MRCSWPIPRPPRRRRPVRTSSRTRSRARSSSTWSPPGTGATPPSSPPGRAPRPSTSSSCSAATARSTRPSTACSPRGPASTCPRSAWCPAGRRTSSPAPSASPASRSRPPTPLLGAIAEGRSRSVGLGRADERWFSFNAGLGWDADVIASMERARGRGHDATPTRYVATSIRRWSRARIDPPDLTVEIPGEEPVSGVRLALVSNTDPWTYLGPRPVRTNPGCSFDSGLGLFALHSLGLPTVLRLVASGPAPRRGRRAALGAAPRRRARDPHHERRARQPPGRRRPPRRAQRRRVRGRPGRPARGRLRPPTSAM